LSKVETPERKPTPDPSQETTKAKRFTKAATVQSAPGHQGGRGRVVLKSVGPLEDRFRRPTGSPRGYAS